MGKFLVLAAVLSGAVPSQSSSAKAMFYDPAAGRPTPVAGPGRRLKSVKWASPFPQYGFVGIHYWFEDANGQAFSEERAPSAQGSLTLHLRGNVGAFVSVWRMDSPNSSLGTQLLYTVLQREDVTVRGPVLFEVGESPASLIIIFGRSETEQPRTSASARSRRKDLSARTGPDGARMVVRESDDVTPPEIGTYVVNRRGMPLATEIVLHR